jgi:16S rRNA (guanine527-N7)-methyltransferase
VKHPTTLDQLLLFLDEQSLCLTALQKEKLRKYHDLLKIYASRMNLMSAMDKQHLVERHLLPSIWLCREVAGLKGDFILDIGSGGGFPGVVVQILFPGSHVVLLESVRKKTRFLDEVCDRLNLPAQVVCARVETYAEDHDSCFDVIVARAVAAINRLWPWSHQLLRPEGFLLAMKGGPGADEFTWLRRQNIAYRRLIPPSEWLSFSSHLRNKHIIKLQK